MKFYILTLFPKVFEVYIKEGLIARSIALGNIAIEIVNLRDYSKNKHSKVDDTVYGGGPGMLLQCGPIYDAIMSLGGHKKKKLIFLSPKGKLLSQKKAESLHKEEELILLCGYYEGFDSRLFDLFEHEKISIGDYVISNGSLSALVLMDAIVRFNGLLFSNLESLKEESFSSHLLEYNQYTKPSSFLNLDVPSVLLKGNHKKIEEYRRRSAIFSTMENRPDLLEKARLSLDDIEIMASFFENRGKYDRGKKDDRNKAKDKDKDKE